MDIIQELNQQASILSEKDLEWILPKIHEKYSSLIKNFAVAAKQHDDLAKSAFEKTAQQSLNQAVNTFLFKKKHWNKSLNLHLYLVKTLSNLKSEKIIQDSVSKLGNAPICPLCKFENYKEFLELKDGKYFCNRCNDILDKYKNQSSKIKDDVRKIFVCHSKTGVRCPDCKKWVPESAFDSGVLPCPYSCGFIGQKSEYYSGSHPVALTKRSTVSLNKELFSSDKGDSQKSLIDTLSSSSISNQEEFLLTEDLEYQFNLIKDVLLQQQKILHNTTTSATILQKHLMYQAFLNILNKHPYEMTVYLAHQKSVSKTPLQCKIFQEYADLVLDYMPFDIVKGKYKHNIVDPCDPRLSLFLGISKYEAIVASDGSIPNNTQENYIGGKQIKDYGPCFIGKLISVTHDDQNLIDSVNYYTFNEIKTSLPPGLKVEVKHFRIASHYEMHSLVFLQRIRRAVVDKVYLLLNKEKRKVKV